MKKISLIRVVWSWVLVAVIICQPILALAQDGRTLRRLTPDQRIDHVLARLTFGARPGDFEHVQKIGIDAYLREQLDTDAIDDSAVNKRLDKLPTLMLSTVATAEQYNPPKPTPTPTPTPTSTPAAVVSKEAPIVASDAMMGAAAETTKPTPTPAPKPTPVPKNPGMVVTELQRAKMLRAVYSEKQLYEVMVDFWENHFSIFANKDADRLLLTSFDRDAIRPNAFGRFRDLLGATAHSPAMLFYLDNWTSSVVKSYPATKDKPARQTGGINENYARELMELHTLGVDGGYTQKDVQEVARCFTGWTIRKPNEEGLAFFNPAAHDNGSKVVLGVKIPAGGGIADGERVLDILAAHPSTARFIATKLARRFVGDDPPQPLIERAARVFLSSGGSITETLKSIITSPEFFSPTAYRSKVRTPFEYAAAALRITGADTDGNRPLLDWLGRMGQPVFGRVTPDGYPDRNSEWLSNNNLLARLNFAAALASGSIKGTKIDTKALLGNTDPLDHGGISAKLSKLILGVDARPDSAQTFQKVAASMPVMNLVQPTVVQGQSPPVTTQPTGNVAPQMDYAVEMLGLIIGSPEFQRR